MPNVPQLLTAAQDSNPGYLAPKAMLLSTTLGWVARRLTGLRQPGSLAGEDNRDGGLWSVLRVTLGRLSSPVT